MKVKALRILAAGTAVAFAVIAAGSVLGDTYPECEGYKPPPELQGKKAAQTSFVGPSGGAVVIVHIGSKILCESVEQGVPSGERRQAEQKVLSGKKLKIHEPTPEDFNAGYAGMGDCGDLHYDCYDKSSPNYGDPQPCAEYAARCH